MSTKVEAAAKAGFSIVSETKKVFQMRCGTGRKIYLTKSQMMDVVIDPLDPVGAKIAATAGFVNEKEYFNSNMRDFPDKLNAGKTATKVGRKLQFDSPRELTDFLSRYSTGA